MPARIPKLPVKGTAGEIHEGGHFGHFLGEALHPAVHLFMHGGFAGLAATLQAIFLKLQHAGLGFLNALGFTFPLTATLAVLAFIRMRGWVRHPAFYAVGFLVLLDPATWLGQWLAIGSVAPDVGMTEVQKTTLQMLGAGNLTGALLGETAARLASGPWTVAWMGKLLESAVTYGWGNFCFSVVMGILMGIFTSFTVDASKRLWK